MAFAGVPTSPRFIRRPEIIKEKALGNLLDGGFPYSRFFGDVTINQRDKPNET